MKVYNMGSEVFEFTHAGVLFVILPKEGKFERVRQPYKVETQGAKGNTHIMTRHIDVWKKTADSGTNSNFVEVTQEGLRACMRAAEAQGLLDSIKKEAEVMKIEQDRVAEIEKRSKRLAEELAEKEQEMKIKLATLERVEKEAFSKATNKYKQ